MCGTMWDVLPWESVFAKRALPGGILHQWGAWRAQMANLRNQQVCVVHVLLVLSQMTISRPARS